MFHSTANNNILTNLKLSFNIGLKDKISNQNISTETNRTE